MVGNDDSTVAREAAIDRDSLVAALERARERPPWTEQLVTEALADPDLTKATADACADCPAPCEPAEVCATTIARDAELFEQVGRDQAFAHVESGMERLEITGRVTVRRVEEIRPNTFVAATGDDLDSVYSDDSSPATATDCDPTTTDDT
ncbi:MAG: hypothetical protein ACQETI_13780 [Halobacteriota archaeon]